MTQTAAVRDHILKRCSPLGDRIVLRVAKPPGKSKGGILYTDQTVQSNRPYKGKVVAVGPGKKLDELEYLSGPDGPYHAAKRLPMDVSVGDTVLFVQFAGMTMQDSQADDQDGEYVVIREEDVVGIVDEEPEADQS